MKSVIIVKFILVFGFSLAKQVGESYPSVVSLLGQVEGHYKTSSNGRRYEAYEGIPYAQPPIGNLRFGVPQPISPWTDVLIARQSSPWCMQYSYLPPYPSGKVIGSEDCLYLNVFTPIRGDSLLPVIFWIHGGAFHSGSGAKYTPKYLLNENVILVTINYRLGPLGFLSTEDEIVPGNMGLKDQAVALRWVANNIRSFGGDPAKVTLFGQSSGGASVHYHYLTNLSSGLFRGGMSFSGTALHSWSLAEDSLEKTRKLATVVSCTTSNVKLMIDCMKARPADRIVQALEKFIFWRASPHVPFGPVVEKEGSELTFINQPPIEIISSRKAQDVPWIVGIVSEEGLYPAADYVTNDTILQEMNDRWDTIAPHLLDYYYTIPNVDHANISSLIKEHYLGSEQFSRSTFNQTVQMIGDRLFVYSCDNAARLQARFNKSPVRFYQFTYRGNHSLSNLLCACDENFGVSHSDEHLYVLSTNFNITLPQDLKMQKKLLKFWTSFATDGSPNVGVEWPTLNECAGEMCYLQIAGPNKIDVQSKPEFGQKNFWHSIGFNENNYTLAA
ncbi:venom carboxylesterase-6-like [Neodiprion fabricii]|uniref:venom carboxylesterase-6-like n=1 Tax=Neodiprion fabricii TaxID=2872261 RepID=UPI001ED93D6C|nr:venom carboxylesterase-6-like [Neodiprion fabricii]